MKRKHWILLALVLILCMCGGVVGWLLWQRRTQSRDYQLEKLKGEISIQLRLGDRGKSIELLERYLELDPSDVDRSLTLASLYNALGKRELAETHLRELLARNENELRVVLALADNLFNRERLAEAWELVGGQLEAAKNHSDTRTRTELWVLGGRLHARLGRVDEGLKLLTEAAKERESFGLRQLDTGDRRVSALLAQGEVLLSAGREKEAEAVLRKAYGVADDAVTVCRLLAGILRRSNRTDEGLEILRKLYALRGDAAQTVAPFLADYLVAVDRRDEALELSKELEAKDERGQGIASYIRGLLAQRQGRASEALKHYRAMARLLPASSQAHLLMAGQAMAVGDVALARSALEQTLSLDPGSVGAELGLLELDERVGEHAAVEARAIRLLGSSKARPRALQSLLTLHRRSPKKTAAAAEARLREVLRATPNDVTAQLYLAVFQLLGEDVVGGAKALAALVGAPTVDLQRALGLVAAASAGSTDLLEAVELLSTVADQDPRLAPAREVLAVLYERLGRRDLARRELDAALAVGVTPTAVEARARLALTDSDRERAEQELTALLSKAPESVPLLRALAVFALERSDLPAARERITRAAQKAPKDPGVHALRGRILTLVGVQGEARKAYAEARQLAPTFSRGYEDGLSLLLAGDPVGARRRFADGLRLSNDPRLAGALAAVLAERGKAGAALGALRRLRVGPETGLFQVHLLHLAGDLPAARRLGERLGLPSEVLAAARGLEIDRRARMYRSYALGVLGWRPELKTLARSLPTTSRDPCQLWWALRAFRPGEPEYLPLAKRLAAVATLEPIAGLDLARAYAGEKATTEETAALRALAGRFPEDGAVALRLGMSLERDGRREEAITQYAKAAAHATGSTRAIAHNNLAFQLSETPERRERAIEHARQAVQALPRSGRVRDTLGWVLFRAGRLGEAQTHLTRAVSMAPANPTLRYHLAALLDRRGARSRAQRHLRIALLSRAPFAARGEAEALAKRLESEEALLSGKAQGSIVTRGKGHKGEIGAEGHAIVRLQDSGGEAALTLEAAAGTDLALFARGVLQLRLQVGAAGTRSIPRLRIPTGGLTVLLRGAPKSPFVLELGSTDPSVGDVEPNERVEQALALAGGAELVGGFHSPADRDVIRLEISPGSASLEIEVFEHPARVELIRSHTTGEEVLKAFELSPGQRLPVGPLREDRRTGWLLRLAPVGTPGRYRLRLNATQVEGDPEPNDRAEEAIPVEVQTSTKAKLGPGDPVDWLRLVGDPNSAVLKIEASAKGGPGLMLRIWQRTPSGIVPLKVYRVGPQPLIVERWRVRAGAELLFEVRAAKADATVDYTLSITPGVEAKPGEETEPNDRSADAESFEERFSGVLELGDVDWVAPTGLKGRHFSIDLTWDHGPVRVGVLGERGGRLLTLSSFTGEGGRLSIPMIARPEGRLRLAILSASRGGAYRLKIASTRAEAGLEVEPNDDLSRASAIHSRLGLRGELSGASDRDLVRLVSARSLTVKATGSAPLQAQLTESSAAALTIQPGQAVTIPAADLSQAAPYLELTRPTGSSGPATYELRQE